MKVKQWLNNYGETCVSNKTLVDALIYEQKNNQTAIEAIKEAFGTKSYLLLVSGFFVCGFHITLVGTHVPKYVVDRGLEDWTAAAILSLIGVFNIFGSLLNFVSFVVCLPLHLVKILKQLAQLPLLRCSVQISGRLVAAYGDFQEKLVFFLTYFFPLRRQVLSCSLALKSPFIKFSK